MEKHHQAASRSSMNKILGYLPKAAVPFQNPLFSPGKDKRSDGMTKKLAKSKTHLSRGGSGPIMSIIQAEARLEKSKFDAQEPTSPKISCMGQIKHRKKLCKNKYSSLPKEFINPVLSSITKMKLAGRKSDASVLDHLKPPLPDRAPSINQMKRFASSRDSHTLMNFDWTLSSQIQPEYQSDGEEYEVDIPFSAPLLATGEGSTGVKVAVEPRKEINLWKRRTMAQPKPLQLNMIRAY